MENIKNKIESLVKQLNEYQDAYYKGRPFVSDMEFDELYDKLLQFEQQYPDLIPSYSPTKRVGSDLDSSFEERAHSIPVLSLDKAYSIDEIITWVNRCKKSDSDSSTSKGLRCVAEQKIDGVSIVLYYENGILAYALTRGNGSVGSDVTENVRTIKDIPMQLPEAVRIAVRGEIYLPKKEFERVNDKMEVPYANPRNLTAGTIRRKKSSDVASVPLHCFCYEGFSDEHSFESHDEMLAYLEKLGFPLNKHNKTISISEPADLSSYVNLQTAEREGLDYEIDGLVFKVDSLSLRDDLGYTGHHPRWAIAYKFDAPTGISTVLGIDIQVGRTGRITPVARIEPVEVGGSTISNATLHNQDYISSLELSIGDLVLVSKRGDVIPAIEEVMEKSENPLWHIPDTCPACASTLVIDGAHHFCPNNDCPDQRLGRLLFFVGKKQMDIENLGEETIQFMWDKKLITSIPEIYSCDYDRLHQFQGFGEKKIELIKQAVFDSKKRPFQQLLWSLGIPDLGPKAVELLFDAGYTSFDSLFALGDGGDAHALTEIHGIGEKTARRIIEAFADPDIRSMIKSLIDAGLSAKGEKAAAAGDAFAGTSWCVTGSFENFKPRTIAADHIKSLGGSVMSGVSSKTSYLLAGDKAGGKLDKAQKLGVAIVTEKEFILKLRDAGIDI